MQSMASRSEGKLKIYFAGSMRGGRHDQQLYQKLIALISEFGTVLTEHVGDPNILEKEQAQAVSDAAIFTQDVSWLKQADVVIAEVTTPSLGVGYEIGVAELLGKIVLCLYRKKAGAALSAMIAGNPALQVVHYEDSKSLSGVRQVLENLLVLQAARNESQAK